VAGDAAQGVGVLVVHDATHVRAVEVNPLVFETSAYLFGDFTGRVYLDPRVTPVVGLVTPPLALSPDPREVEEVFEVPLGFLLDPSNHRRETRELQGRTVGYYDTVSASIGFQLGVQAQVPMNSRSGKDVGVKGLLHFFLDDIAAVMLRCSVPAPR